MTSSEELVSVELLCDECFLVGFCVFRILETKFDYSFLGAGGLIIYTDSQQCFQSSSRKFSGTPHDEAKIAVNCFGFLPLYVCQSSVLRLFPLLGPFPCSLSSVFRR